MSLARIFGWGSKKIIAQNLTVPATVTDVKNCWWLKVNTKPVRSGTMDGAVFPHIITFVYSVDGREYTGEHYINWNAVCPKKGDNVTVFYDGTAPEKYALIV